MGACTVTLDAAGGNLVEGSKRTRFGTLSPSASYATNGDTVAAADFGLNVLDDLEIDLDVAASRFGTYDKTNGKVKVFTALSTEAVNATNQSAIVFRVRATGY
jgi:hypothetical protein